MRGVPPGMMPAGVSGGHCVTGFLVLDEEVKKMEVSPRYQILVSLLHSILLDFSFLVVIPSSLPSERIIKYPIGFLNCFLD